MGAKRQGFAEDQAFSGGIWVVFQVPVPSNNLRSGNVEYGNGGLIGAQVEGVVKIKESMARCSLCIVIKR